MNSLSAPPALSVYDNSTLPEMITEVGSSSSDDEEEEPKPPPKKPMKTLSRASMLRQDNVEQEKSEELEKVLSEGKATANLGKLELTSVPVQLLLAPHLVELILSDNKIGPSLEAEPFRALLGLKRVNLANNHIRTVPIELFQLPLLQELLLDHNNIHSLPIDTPEGEGFLCLPNLEKFGGEWNRLQAFPTALVRRCPKLTEMFLAENSPIQSFPPVDLVFSLQTPVKVKVDNRPRLVTEQRTWIESRGGEPANFNVEWNKIYPDLVPMDGEHFIYLGSLRTAQVLEVYEDLNIKWVLTAARDLSVKLSTEMEQLELRVDDLPGEDMRPFFAEAFQFINVARMRGEGVLIHCFAGLSRSVTVTCAYLMHTMGWTRDKAMRHIRKYRPAANPNEGFMRSLKEFEQLLVKEGRIRPDAEEQE
jgi:protein-tyrosine phosphatase